MVLGGLFFELLADGLAGAEDVDLYLGLADVEDVGDVAVALAFDVAQLDAGSLLVGQGVDDLLHALESVVADGVVEGCGPLVGYGRGEEGVDGLVLVVHAAQAVEREVVAEGVGVGFEGLDGVPLFAPLP